MKTVNRILLLTLLAPMSITSWSKAVHEATLDNGLKILVKPVNKTPVATVQLWYKVGSSYEHTGITGISHMLEHLMFKGTPKYPNNRFATLVNSIGGNQNAFTSRDFTAYYQNISKQHVEKMLALEADRMRNLSWQELAFIKERKVVAEERRLRVEDRASSKLFEFHRMQSFTLNPNRIPVIGWMDDIQNYQLSDLKEWYDRWYHPNNATLVVVGSVSPEKVFRWAKKYYGSIRKQELPKVKPRNEPINQASRINKLSIPERTPRTIISFPVPSFGSLQTSTSFQGEQPQAKDIYTLIMLAGVFDNGSSARLVSDMVLKKNSVASVSASYNPYSINADLFSFSALSNGNKTLLEIETELLEHIKSIQKTPPDSAEMSRVLAQAESSHVYQKDSLFYQGYELGALESIGVGWQIAEDFLTKLAQVSALDIQQAAKKYLKLENSIISRLNGGNPDS